MSIHAVSEPRVPPPSSANPATVSPALPSPAPPTNPEQPSAFGRLVRGLGAEVQRGEAVVHHAIASASGGDLDPGQLIALQAGVYRYAEAVDLASRLVDHATTGLKTVIQGT
jgi:hypothetical protein